MRKFISELLRRGVTACGAGPLILAVLYLILKRNGAIEALTVDQVCTGIFSLTTLAFLAGGMNAIYQLERLPLMVAVLIHGSVLYVGYLITYLVNDWLDRGPVSIAIFTAIFILGYLTIWAVIYSIVKRSTDKLNEALKNQQCP